MEFSPYRLASIVGVAIAAHLIVLGIKAVSSHTLRSRISSEAKIHTITSFTSSLLVFGIYFGATGFVLSEIGVPLTTYLASVSVIGLAVSFGSQGVVQDVITGLTVVTSDLLDIGDMVEIGGEVGIVEHVGMRFTVLINLSGARVYIPNRSIASVINYPKGYIRAFLDVRVPSDASQAGVAEERANALVEAAYEQYPGILLLPPSFEGRRETADGHSFLRYKFRIWPRQGRVLEESVKANVVEAMKGLDGGYAAWMVTVHYRVEPRDSSPAKRLPAPAALRRLREQREREASR